MRRLDAIAQMPWVCESSEGQVVARRLVSGQAAWRRTSFSKRSPNECRASSKS